jgi:hypothetical protein
MRTAEAVTILAADGGQFSGIMYVAQLIGTWLLTLAPFLVVAGFVYSAFLWVWSGGNPERVKKAKDQLYRTIIALAVIAGYFILKGLIIGLTLDPFGS